MSLEEIRGEKIRKLEALRAAGVTPYPADTHATHTIAAVLEHFNEWERLAERSGKVVTIAGRMVSKRGQGGTVFCHLYDGTGKIQGYIKLADEGSAEGLPAEEFELFSKVDPSDFVELRGECMKTKRGEPSLFVLHWRLLAKALVPVPTEHFGVEDEEERLRKRYLDILTNSEVKKRIEMRSKFWNVCRAYLLERGFIEVETPALEVTTGGADARPFTAHHNALDMPVHLRISAGELWQKRLMVAGINRTFEIGRIFRNEGMSFEHAQDYTQQTTASACR
jgi:lysyl-tRNA synthetase, class II